MLCCLAAGAAYCGDEQKDNDSWRYANAARGAASVGMISEQKLAKVVPGLSTKAQVQRLLGTPWRVVQFNDCGAAMPGQADETWDYRGRDSAGATYRVHIEFDDHNVADLVAKIPDKVLGGKGTPARTAPGESSKGMTMSAKSMPM
jgi:outer membrane protein assembly factor BamE (lipoprotein component of BamABCDE complex)